MARDVGCWLGFLEGFGKGQKVVDGFGGCRIQWSQEGVVGLPNGVKVVLDDVWM